MSLFPYNWALTNAIEIAEPIRGVTYKKEQARESSSVGFTPVLRANNIQQNKIEMSDLVYVPDENISQNQRLRKNDIVVAMSSGSISVVGKSAQVLEDIHASFGAFCGALRPNNLIVPKYLGHFLKSEAYRSAISNLARGVNINNLKWSHFEEIEIPLAPLPEQKRIADKLDTVLARVDACRERLNRVPLILKRFRQSVLAAAMSGMLTEDWRNREIAGSEFAGNGRYSDANDLVSQIKKAQVAAKIKMRGGVVKPALSDLPDQIELPVKWSVAGFDSLAAAEPNALKAGPFGSALKKSMYVSEGYKIYGQEQVIAGDEELGDYFITDDKFQSLSSCAVKAGDILISLVGTIGRVLILSNKCKPGIINPRLVKLSLHSSISRQYVALYLSSPITQHFFAKQSHGGTMDILNLGILRELPILLPPEAEQYEIVRRVETLFAFADRLEARLATARAATDRLTPALLAKAFRGELVPQDPNDEPAAELLKRLAAARAATSDKPRRGRAAKVEKRPSDHPSQVAIAEI